MNFIPKITVSIEVQPMDIKTVSYNLPTNIIDDILQPIDFPKRGADAFEEHICTSRLQIKRTVRARQEICNEISETITTALLNLIGSKDTLMGYPIETHTRGNLPDDIIVFRHVNGKINVANMKTGKVV